MAISGVADLTGRVLAGRYRLLAPIGAGASGRVYVADDVRLKRRAGEKALNLALALKPKHVLPIHDWHWRDEARESTYQNFEQILGKEGITFYKLQTGVPVDIPL